MNKERNSILNSIIWDYLWKSNEYSYQDREEVSNFLYRKDHRKLTTWFDYMLTEGFNEASTIYDDLLKNIKKEWRESVDLGVEFDTESRIRSEISSFKLKAAEAKKELERIKEVYTKEDSRAYGHLFFATHTLEIYEKNAEWLGELIDKLNEKFEGEE